MPSTQNDKGTKQYKFEKTSNDQMHRAYLRYPDCDKKRVGPCSSTKNSPKKV